MLRTIALVVEINLPICIRSGDVTVRCIFIDTKIIAIIFSIFQISFQNLSDQKRCFCVDALCTTTVWLWQFGVNCLFDTNQRCRGRSQNMIQLSVGRSSLLTTDIIIQIFSYWEVQSNRQTRSKSKLFSSQYIRFLV